ncbi:MAG: 4Fe-4S dicluster domain-containing protein [Spirochaetaceae bacterium]|nr:4Fe-4S dicluster domain-containing protein [Spirochaetaceae bacterium]
MVKVILARLRQGYRTIKYPAGAPPEMPDRFRGRPLLSAKPCPGGCRDCAAPCPTGALDLSDAERLGPSIDLGRCLFCDDCVGACPQGSIAFSRDYRLAATRREDLLVGAETAPRLAAALQAKTRSLFGRSLKLRQVSAGGCNACEADANVLTTIGWDIGRFGIQFVASPRHADGLLITGPVTKNMELALRKTYDAVPEPKIVILAGSCAISGGPYIGHERALDGASSLLPIDLLVPGCPPHPLTLLDGLLRLLGRIKE